MPSLIFFAPAYDEITQRLASWADYCASDAEAAGWQVKRLFGTDATRENLLRALGDQGVVGLDAFCHGQRSYLVGQTDGPALSVPDGAFRDLNLPDDLALLRSIGIDALACHSSAVLGRRATQARATFYLGYDDKCYPFHEEEDMLAMTTAKRLLYRGMTARDAFQAQVVALRERYEWASNDIEYYTERQFFERNWKRYRRHGDGHW